MLYELDKTGWRVVFSTQRPKAVFSGRIETEGSIGNVYNLPCGADRIDSTGQAIEFEKVLLTYESWLQFNVGPGDAPVGFQLTIDGQDKCADRIIFGSSGTHPASNIFQISPSDASVRLDELTTLLKDVGQLEGVLIIAVEGSEAGGAKTVRPAKMDARRQEALKALGYVR